jgi:serine/threonine-protein kinase
VKPQNLLLGRDGLLKLGDFGIAVGHEGTRVTLVGTVLGTAGYLAPEQARGEQVTAAADIYAVGAVLYELLTGEPARATASLADLGAAGAFDLPDFAGRARSAPPARRRGDGVPRRPGRGQAAVGRCAARRLAPVASEAETRARRAIRRGARPRSSRRPPGRRLGGGRRAGSQPRSLSPPRRWPASWSHSHCRRRECAAPEPGPPAVAPPAVGTNAAEQARNLADWLRSH